MRERRWLLLALYGLLLATAVTGALKATRPKFKIATTSTTTTEEPDAAENENGEIEVTTVAGDVNATTKRTLTGIPQIDYIWDPNLPRELNGYNLSDYPFYSGIPEEITFKCDGLHDGFYASVAHKCQVYHHCLYGTRYDFLCANFTAFDQRTFICHFASEVDCVNSKKFWHRNDALYKAAETTTTSTTSTSTTTTAQPPQARPIGRRRRPHRRRPAYDYYDEEYYEEDAYERIRPRGYDRRGDDYDYDDRKYNRRDRDRDRDYRDRDYRDREIPRPRESERPMREPERPIIDDREGHLSPRERFPSRNNRRDPVRPAAILPRDSVADDEPKIRNRDQDLPPRSRDPEDSSIDERRSLDSRNRDIDDRRPLETKIRDDDGRRPLETKIRDDERRPLETRDRDVDDRRPLDTRNRDVDDRRYNDKGYRDDYDDSPSSASSSSSGSSDILVKPAAPPASVYARPRAPPKIRRPVPLNEQDKFAYKATSAPPTSAIEARRRPIEIPVEDDFYEDELEEIRPRRPASRRRPGFRDFYESPRERDRDRPFRPRYREDGDDVRPRKHQERNRERYYERGPERGRDRSLDRSKDRPNDRIPESSREKPAGRLNEERINAGREREHDNERPRSLSRSKESLESPETTKRPSIYERTSVSPSTTSTTTAESSTNEDTSSHNVSDRPERPFRGGSRQDNNSAGRTASTKPEAIRQETNENVQDDPERETSAEKHLPTRLETSSRNDNSPKVADKPKNDPEEYSGLEEYYDEPEYQPAPPPPPRTAVRIVKRPFLPSRGGNPNPRGLSPVGSKAPGSSRKQETSLNRPSPSEPTQVDPEVYRPSDDPVNTAKTINDDDDKRPYDTYKFAPPNISQKPRSDYYEEVITRPTARRPNDDDEDQVPNVNDPSNERSHDDANESLRIPTNNDDGISALRNVNRGRTSNEDAKSNPRDHPPLKWNSEEFRLGQRGDVRHEQDKTDNSDPNHSKSSRLMDFYEDEQVTSGNLPTKQTLNEVVTHHRLQDIPESEYDVTLNEALTPSFNAQESNLPSGFVLPIHRQLGRDPILQSTENSYKISRPYNQPGSQNHQQNHQTQQKPFVPSPQFLPLTGIGNSNERSRSIQYFRTPEVVHVTGPQYRTHQRGPWHDYTGY